MKKLFVFGVWLLLAVSTAFGRSPAGTAEFEAEGRALSMMATDFGGYKPLDAQLRGNQLSISIPAKNARGTRVDFKCYVKKVPVRTGGFRYEVSRPVFGQ